MQFAFRAAILAVTLASSAGLAQSTSTGGGGGTSTSTNIRGNTDGNGKVESKTDAIARERENLPLPALMESLNTALGEKSSAPLSADQSRRMAALNADFEKQVKEFLRKHAGNQGGDSAIPDRANVEKQILDLLNKDQRAAAENALRDTADKRVTERHHEKHSESHSDKKSGGDGNSSWQTSTSSQRSSESSSQKSSQSSSQSGRDSKSDSRSDSKSNKSSDKKSSKNADKTSSDQQDWSKLSAPEKKAVVHDLLQQLPAKDREELAKELNLSTAR